MQFLVDFFEGFKNFFVMLWDFVSNLISGIGKLIAMVPGLMKQFNFMEHMLPSVITGTAGIILIVSVIYLIVGRSSGES